jgi:hypothetical protein
MELRYELRLRSPVFNPAADRGNNEHFAGRYIAFPLQQSLFHHLFVVFCYNYPSLPAQISRKKTLFNHKICSTNQVYGAAFSENYQLLSS